MKSARRAGSYEVAALLITGFWLLGWGTMSSAGASLTAVAGVSAYRVDGLRGALVPKSPADCNAAPHVKVSS